MDIDDDQVVVQAIGFVQQVVGQMVRRAVALFDGPLFCHKLWQF